MNIQGLIRYVSTALVLGFGISGLAQDTNKSTASPGDSTSLKLPIDISLGNDWHFSPMLRQDWTDILNNGGEAMGQTGNMQGATFSYSGNPSTHTASWSAIGAAIGSFAYRPTSTTQGLNVIEFSVAPIVAVDRVSSSGTNSVDNLYFGLGQGAAFLFSNGKSPYDSFALGLEERAAFIYDTDFAFKASLPGAIFELEPQLLFNNGANSPNLPNTALGWPMGIGSLASGNSAAVLQFRTWFHLEGGDVQQSGTNWNTVNGSFLRVGVETRAQITFPGLYNLGLSGEYDYIPTVTGPSGRNSLYKLGFSAPLAFLSGANPKSPPFSLAVNYTRGGLILNNQNVNSLTAGISVLF